MDVNHIARDSIERSVTELGNVANYILSIIIIIINHVCGDVYFFLNAAN